MDTIAIYGILSSLLFSAFFSGIEIAFISSNKLHIELLKNQGKKSAAIISVFYNNSSSFIGTCLIGNTLALVVFGVYMATLLDPLLVNLIPVLAQNDVMLLLTQTLISTLVVLMLAEFLPKSLFMINPESILIKLAYPFKAIHILLKPFTWLVIGITRVFIEKILGMQYREDKTVFGLTDLNNYLKTTISSDEGEEEPAVDAAIFNNAIQFKTLKVRDCMIPRTDIVSIDIEEGMDTLLHTFIDSGHSKVLIHKDSIDNIIGYCHLQSLLKKPRSIDGIIKPIIYVPETLPANEMMVKFISGSKSIALVVDEYGGTSGLVTIEDVMEEIFGEIKDEYDTEDYLEIQEADGSFTFSARLEIDYLNEKYSLAIPEGDYETLGGFILSKYEDLPTPGENIHITPYHFTILSMDEARIDSVRLEYGKDLGE